MRTGHALTALLLACMAWPASAAAPRLDFGAAWSPEDCGLFKLTLKGGDDAVCGRVGVPLRHGVAGSPTIQLAVVVIPALHKPGRQPDPLFLAQGGPGGSTIGGFGQVLLDDPGKRPTLNRDLVLWDQRGTYLSQPRLRCHETDELPDDNGDDRTALLKAYGLCGERLGKDASGDLSAFNSQENARDAEDVRAALGYERFNFYGVSYGSELGQFLMRERPRNLRSVVLDAVVPVGFNLVTDVPAVRQRVMMQYARSCAAVPACNEAYPDLAQRYAALLDRLDRDPVPLPAHAFGSAQPRSPASTDAKGTPAKDTKDAKDAKPPTLTGKDLDDALYQALYMREAVSLVPYVIDRADQGDYSFALNFALLMQSSRDEMADAMYATVVCSEFGDTPQAALKFPGMPQRLAESGRSDGQAILDLCRLWTIKLLDKALLQPVRSDIPTLLLSGTYDPITPPAHADHVAQTLGKAFRVTFPSGTHGQAFTVPCANRLIEAFLDDPSKAPDSTCAREAQPHMFTPDELIALPARRQGGSATLLDQASSLAGPALALALALVLLFSAVPIYSVAELWHVLRGDRRPVPSGWRGRLVRAAPWVPVFCGFMLLTFLLAAAHQVGDALGRNQFLLLVGALPARLRELGWWLLPYGAAALLMTVSLVLLWRHRARSVAGRLYYTLLVLCAWAACAMLLKTGLIGL